MVRRPGRVVDMGHFLSREVEMGFCYALGDVNIGNVNSFPVTLSLCFFCLFSPFLTSCLPLSLSLPRSIFLSLSPSLFASLYLSHFRPLSLSLLPPFLSLFPPSIFPLPPSLLPLALLLRKHRCLPPFPSLSLFSPSFPYLSFSANLGVWAIKLNSDKIV